MENKNQQAYHPPTTNGYTRSGEEAGAPNAEELRRQKRKKWIIYGAAFVVFQTAIIVIFSLTIMKVKTPKFRVRSASFDTLPTVTNSSFNLRTTVQFGVKNTNFGPYKYDNTTVVFLYGDTPVGNAVMRKSKANFLSTKKVSVSVDLTLTTVSANDISSGIVPLKSQARMNGKVELMLIFKKKKSVNMNCTMEVHTTTKELQNIKCK